MLDIVKALTPIPEVAMQIGRILGVATLLASGLSGCSSAPAKVTDAERSAIRLAIESFTDAVRKGDYATAASWYAEDAVFMPPNAPAVEGRAAIQKALEGFGRVNAFSQPIVEINGEGDLAYARVNYDLTLVPPGTSTPMTDKGKVLIVMKKQADGKWRTIQGMFNSNLPAPR